MNNAIEVLIALVIALMIAVIMALVIAVMCQSCTSDDSLGCPAAIESNGCACVDSAAPGWCVVRDTAGAAVMVPMCNLPACRAAVAAQGTDTILAWVADSALAERVGATCDSISHSSGGN